MGSALRALWSAPGRLAPAHRRSGEDRSRSLWIFNQYTYTPDMPESIRHWELATLLDRRGWETRIFASAFNHRRRHFDRPVTLRRPALDTDEQGVAFTWLYTSPYGANDWRRYRNMVTYFATSLMVGLRKRPCPSVVVGTSPHLLAGLAAWMIARRHRVPFVLEIQDLWPDTLVAMGLTNPLVIRPLELLERFLYRRADAVVALSEGIRDGVAQRSTDPRKVVLLPNATTETRGVLQGDRDDLRRRYGWQDSVVAVYAGSHGPANGLENVVDAALLQGGEGGVVFAFLGDGSEKAQLIARAAGAEHIVFLDPVPKGDVHAILTAADIGVINLRWNKTFEGARPNKIFDYLGAGLPIVTTVPGEIWRIVDEAHAGRMAEPENPASLAAVVDELARDGELRNQLSGNARTYAETLPTRADTAAQLEDLLVRLIAGTAPASAGGD
jgi:glycosyltransferase involved in cell wall biosynthesis